MSSRGTAVADGQGRTGRRHGPASTRDLGWGPPPLPPGWPLVVLLGAFPVFWALGLPNLAVTIMAVPMLLQLIRKRHVVFPRGFMLWALFLLWSAVGVLMLGVNPADTVPDSPASRLLAFGVRELSYFSVTIVLIYIGNLTEAEFSQKRLVRLLGVFFVWTVLGGVVGMLWPYFQFTSPFELLLPDDIRYNLYVQHLVHPTTAQVQDLIGTQTPRPAAPFGYTNTWGFHVTVLGIWFIAGSVIGRSQGAKLLSLAILGVGAVTLIYSLNRAAWLGCALALGYIVVRLALRRRVLPLALVMLAVSVGTLAVFASPLQAVIDARLNDGKSNSIRAFTAERALDLSRQSPVLGYGSTRQSQGSAASIAVGKSADCPQCGNVSIGINGYAFMLLVSTGWVGAFLFFSFLIVQILAVRGISSNTVAAGVAVILLTVVYGLAYDISTWMLVPFVTLGLLWREVQQRQAGPT